MPKENANVKDSVFVDLFQTYEKAAEYDRSLVRWLMNLPDDWNGKITPVHLEDTFYKSFINDVSFLTDDVLLVLMEHQSTVNPNMPFRALLYVARLLEMFVDVKARYKKKLAPIPKPVLYVFYNGKEELPLVSELRLSTAYKENRFLPSIDISTSTELPLEVVVTVININTCIGGKENELIKKCPILWDYSRLMQAVRDKRASNKPEYLKEAINDCIKSGILTDYLSSRRSEVCNMLIAEYDYDTDIAVTREEAWEDGHDAGLEEGCEKGIILGEENSRIKYASKMISRGTPTDKIVSELVDLFEVEPDYATELVEKAKTDYSNNS